jgi:hypothetical protein
MFSLKFLLQICKLNFCEYYLMSRSCGCHGLCVKKWLHSERYLRQPQKRGLSHAYQEFSLQAPIHTDIQKLLCELKYGHQKFLNSQCDL